LNANYATRNLARREKLELCVKQIRCASEATGCVYGLAAFLLLRVK
jgi:hypothetical protein